MTAEPADDDPVERLLAQALDAAAGSIDVPDAWDAIARRLLMADGLGAPPGPVSGTRSRRLVSGVVVALGVAAVLVVAVVLGWRPSAAAPAPAAPAPAAPATVTVPRYDGAIPTLVVYRTTAGSFPTPGSTSDPAEFTLTPERMRTGSSDLGRAALEALFATPPAQPGSVSWLDQKIDISSVTVSRGRIRVELSAFSSPVYPDPEARVMAQAWVRTLQDSLGVRDDVVLTLRGRPFRLYHAIDTATPLRRDTSVLVVRPAGVDSPRSGDVVPSTFVLLGSAAAGEGKPARVQVVDVDTGAIAYEQEQSAPFDRDAPVDFQPVLTLEPGRYRATVTGYGAVSGNRDVSFTVVP